MLESFVLLLIVAGMFTVEFLRVCWKYVLPFIGLLWVLEKLFS